jgi:hypothetical protein
VECHYEEKNENLAPAKLEVELVETALRETRIGDHTPQRAQYIHTLEAQSSVDSDVIAHNVRTPSSSVINVPWAYALKSVGKCKRDKHT